jgi:hypothetical protein
MIMVPSVLALCVSAALATRRGRPVSVVARIAQLVSAASVLACPMVAVIQLAFVPGGAVAQPVLGMLMAVVFAAEIGGYLWLVLRRPGPLGAWRHSGVLGLAAAAAVAAVLFLANQHHGQVADFVVTGGVEVTAILAPLAAGALAVLMLLTRSGGLRDSMRAGVAECLWGVVLSPLAAFLVDLLTTQDDLGRATIILTGVSLVFVLVLLLARRIRVAEPLRTATT